MDKVYAIGDIHGEYDMMKTLLDNLPDDGTVIFLGDYVDRGPNSRKVMQTVLTMKDAIKIIGNHDMWMFENTAYEWWNDWPETYGKNTVASYSYDKEKMREDASILVNQVGHLYYEWDGKVFSHSGGHPHKTLEENTTNDWLWFRHPVKDADYAIDGRYSVHGHTPVYDVWVGNDRCNVDTGCGKGGSLSCAEFIKGKRFPVKRHTVDRLLNYKWSDIVT